MNRLANALAFAAVVIAAMVMDSNLPQRLASSPLVARVVRSVRCDRPARLVTPEGPAAIEQANLERAMERMQAAQARLAGADMKRLEVRLQTAPGAPAVSDCKVTKLEQ